MIQLVKKKRLNEIKPVAFRQIGFVEEKNKTEKKQSSAHQTSKNNEASLKIDAQILEEKKSWSFFKCYTNWKTKRSRST